MNRTKLTPPLTRRMKALKSRSALLGLGLALTVTTAIAQVAPTMAEQLRSVVSYYGDAQGNLPIRLEQGEVRYLATASGRAPYAFYTLGDPVADDASLAACGVGPAGEPEACDPAYSHALIYGLQDLQSAQPDPSELTIKCEKLYPDKNTDTKICMVYRPNKVALCYLCSHGPCTPC